MHNDSQSHDSDIINGKYVSERNGAMKYRCKIGISIVTIIIFLLGSFPAAAMAETSNILGNDLAKDESIPMQTDFGKAFTAAEEPGDVKATEPQGTDMETESIAPSGSNSNGKNTEKEPSESSPEQDKNAPSDIPADKSSAKRSAASSSALDRAETIKHDFGDGEGAVDAKEIVNVEQLKAIGESDSTLAGNYVLANSGISLTEPIGSFHGRGKKDSHPFTGKFDGQGIAIRLSMNQPDGSDLAIFAYLDEDALVQNLNTTGGINGKSTCAGIAALNEGHIKNCTNQADITVTDSAAGGIAAYTYETGVIEGCKNGVNGNINGKIKASYNAGGITALLTEGGAVKNCINYEDVTTTTSPTDYIDQGTGGIIGGNISDDYYHSYNDNTATTIEACENRGKVEGIDLVGGIIGWYCNITSSEDAIVQECRNYGQVTGKTQVGGIAGRGDQAIVLSYNEKGAKVTATSEQCGGIVGFLRGVVYDCRNKGDVSGVNHTGGICGFVDKVGMITYAFNNGNVTGTQENTGGIAGYSEARDTELCMKFLRHVKIKVRVPITEHNITFCGNYGKVETTEQDTYSRRTGGVVGYLKEGDIYYIFNEGIVDGVADVGGIIGYGEDKDTSVQTFYSTGTIRGKAVVGGIAGHGGNLVRFGYTASPVQLKTDGHWVGIVEGDHADKGGDISYIYYNSETVNCPRIVGHNYDSLHNADKIKPLTTAQMTGADALSNMKLITNVEQDLNAQWVTKAETAANWDNGTTKQSFYPSLKDLESNGIEHPAVWLHQFDQTQFEPFRYIENAEDLENINYYIETNCVLKNDLDLSAQDKNFLPINKDAPFIGKLDGLGHKITLKNSESGLFNKVQGEDDKTPYIANLTVTGSIYNDDQAAYYSQEGTHYYVINLGTIANEMSGGTIKNCTSTCSITLDKSSIISDTGGFAGATNKVDINNCTNKGNMTANCSVGSMGGIAGRAESRDGQGAASVIQNCTNTGRIEGSGSSNTYYIGGIAGLTTNTTVKSCTNEADIYAPAQKAIAGGIIGQAQLTVDVKSTIENCRSAEGCTIGANLDSLSEKKAPGTSGGIVGSARISAKSLTLKDTDYLLQSCYNQSTVVGALTGGIAGYSETVMGLCANYGTVLTTGDGPYTYRSDQAGYTGGCAGGLAGCVDASYISALTKVMNCFNVGQVTGVKGGTPDLAGLIGRAYDNNGNGQSTQIRVNNCYSAGQLGGVFATASGATAPKEGANIVGLVNAQNAKNETTELCKIDISYCYYNTDLCPAGTKSFVGSNVNGNADDPEHLHIEGGPTNMMTGIDYYDEPTQIVRFRDASAWDYAANDTLRKTIDGVEYDAHIEYYPHLKALNKMGAPWPMAYQYTYGPDDGMKDMIVSQNKDWTGKENPFDLGFPGLDASKYQVAAYYKVIEGTSGKNTYEKLAADEQPQNVGKYIALCKITDSSYNYQRGIGVLNILRATIDVSADHLTKFYGQPMPDLTYKIDGPITKEELEKLTEVSITTTATEKTTWGIYPIHLKVTLPPGGEDHVADGSDELSRIRTDNYHIRAEDGSIEIFQDSPVPYTIEGTKGGNGHSDWYISPVTITPDKNDKGYDKIYSTDSATADSAQFDLLSAATWGNSTTVTGESGGTEEKTVSLWMRNSGTTDSARKDAITSPAKVSLNICTKALTAEPVSPKNNAHHDPSDTTFKIKFNQQMEKGIGYFYLYKEDGSKVQKISATSKKVQITNDKDQDTAEVALKFSGLLDANTTYYVGNDRTALYTIRGKNFDSMAKDDWTFKTNASSDQVKIKDLQLDVACESDSRLAAKVGSNKLDYAAILVPNTDMGKYGELDITPIVKGVLSKERVDVTIVNGKRIPTAETPSPTEETNIGSLVEITDHNHVKFIDDSLQYVTLKITAKGNLSGGSGDDSATLKLVRTGWEVARVEDKTSLDVTVSNLLEAVNPEGFQIPDNYIARIAFTAEPLSESEIGTDKAAQFKKALNNKTVDGDTIGTYLNFTLKVDYLDKNGQTTSLHPSQTISETAKPLKISFTLPKGTGGNRDYGMLYLHEDGIHNITGQVKNNVFETESSQFCPYALIYTTLYDVGVKQADNGTISIDKERAAKDEKVTATAVPAGGYRLLHLTVNGESVDGLTFDMPAKDSEVSAVFVKQLYTITAQKALHGTVTVDKKAATMGATVTVSTTPEDGYRLAKILVNGKAITGSTFTMPTENVTVSALFVKQIYTITVRPADNGTISVNKTQATKDSKITVTANPDKNYKLKQITVNGKTITGNTFRMPCEDVTVSASFTKLPAAAGGVSGSTNNRGGSSGGGSSANQTSGTGDSFPVIPLIVILIACGGLLCGLILYGRRKK